MKRINLAYETLSDPNKRAAYDQARGARQGQRPPSPPPPPTSGAAGGPGARPPGDTSRPPPGRRNGGSSRKFVFPLVALGLVAIVVIAIIVNAGQDGGDNVTPASTVVTSPTWTATAVDTPTATASNTDIATARPTPRPTPVPPTRTPSPPIPDPYAVKSLSGTGNASRAVVLDPGRYQVTATINGNCQGSTCDQPFEIRVETLSSGDVDRFSVARSVTDDSFEFPLRVGDFNTSPSRRDVLEGLQFINVTAIGAWTIEFSLQETSFTFEPTATPETTAVPTAIPVPTATPVSTAIPVPTATPVSTAIPVPTATPVSTATPVPIPTPTPGQVISGTGDTIDFVSLESGRYVVTATINGSFRIESVFGESYHRMSESRLSVDNPYAFRLNVGEHLAEGKQLVEGHRPRPLVYRL